MNDMPSTPRSMTSLRALVDCGCIALRAGRIADALELFQAATRCPGTRRLGSGLRRARRRFGRLRIRRTGI